MEKLLRKTSIPIIVPIIVIGLLVGILMILLISCIQPSTQEFQYFRRTKIEIKAWVDINGTYGMEIVPEVSINGNYFNKITGDMQPLWLDNRYRYTLEAKERIGGYCFLFWQRESDGLIIPNRTLVLEPGFTHERWWINYGKCPSEEESTSALRDIS